MKIYYISIFLLLMVGCNDTKTTMSKQGKKMELKSLKKKKFSDVRNKIDGNLVKVVSPGIIHYKKYYIGTRFDDESKPFDVKVIVPEKFEFYNKDGDLVNEFDIEKSNLFLQNNPPKIIIRKQYSDAEGTVFYPKSEQTGKEKIIEKHLWTTIEYQDGFSKVVYKENSIGDYGRILSTASYMVVLDSIGNMVFSHKYPGSTSFAVISRDGKYAMFSIFPIETTANAGIKTQTEGFEIWNTRTNKQLYSERNDNPDMWISEPFVFDKCGFLKVDYTYPNSKEIAQKDYAFDPVNIVLYSRVFTKEEYKEIALNWKAKYKTYKSIINKFKFEKIIINEED